jgi:hypothetical protein
MTIGIEIVESQPNGVYDMRPRHPANIRLKLETSEGLLVVLEEARLDDWVWSHGVGDSRSFYYRRGEGKEIPMGNGATREERVGRKAHEGWGTYFAPDTNSNYILTVTVLDVEPTPQSPARLVVEGGGWK